MHITLIFSGKTNEKYLLEGIEKYLKRLKNYVKIDVKETKDIKFLNGMNILKYKELEYLQIEKFLNQNDEVFLLDENGIKYNSLQFSAFFEKMALKATKNLTVVVGGPYGFDDNLVKKAKGIISLSNLTFTHQMVRLILVEQIYRAFTIIRKEPYHHI